MLLNEIKNIKSTKKELRSFGLTVGIFLILLGSFLWWRQKESFLYFIEGGFVLLILGLLFPVVLKPIQKIWMGLALVIGYFMTRVILSILFYLILTPISLISRMMGKAFLDLRIDQNANSYWIKKLEHSFNKENYEKQF